MLRGKEVPGKETDSCLALLFIRLRDGSLNHGRARSDHGWPMAGRFAGAGSVCKYLR